MRGIIFQPDLVGVLLARGTIQTRRIVKPQPDSGGLRWNTVVVGGHGGWTDMHGNPYTCPYGGVGDQLYVKEPWRTESQCDRLSPSQMADAVLDVDYKTPWAPIMYADGTQANWDAACAPGRSRRALHMPQWASRATVEIVRVDVQRLGDMTDEDALASGIQWSPGQRSSPVLDYAVLWNQIHGKKQPWQPELWVWVIDLKVVTT